jgi:tetratricopeptide (TPR) repeat protein
MEQIHQRSLARIALAAGLLAWLSGCGSFDLASPNSSLGWGPGGRSGRITPAEQADLQITFGKVAERQGDIEGAEAAYRQALKRDKSRGDAQLYLANMHTLKGDYRTAQLEYQKALELNPGNADVFCDIGYSFYLQHRWDEAERNLKQALAIMPNHRRAHNNLAVLYAHTDRSSEALAEFRRGGSSLADAHSNLAFSLTLDQKWQPAREQYRQALAAGADSELLRARLHEVDRLVLASGAGSHKPTASSDPATIPVARLLPPQSAWADPSARSDAAARRVVIPPPFTLGKTLQ